MTIFGFILGLLIHSLKQLETAKRVGNPTSIKSYFFDNWPESAMSVITGVCFLFGVPELCILFPDATKVIEPLSRAEFFWGVICGGLGNSLADLIGKRVEKLFGAS
jgi:hypothetical protein